MATIDPVQDAFLAAKLAATTAQQPQFAHLAQRLLSLGGRQVVACLEEDITALLERGTQRATSSVTLCLGEPCRCHANAASLYRADPTNRIVTGWALSDDGLWRQHSWCEHDRELIETTATRRCYFGFELHDAEADVFAEENFW
jgi:hypothetical protein